MTESVREYLLSVVAVALLSGVVLALTPKGAVHRTLTFLSGLAMILTALGPVARLDFDTLAQSMARTRIEAEEAAEGVNIDSTELIAELIKEESETYIWDKAAAMEIELTEVTVEVRTDGTYPYPYSVVLTADCTDELRQRFTKALEEELAIPAERQEWHTDEGQ